MPAGRKQDDEELELTAQPRTLGEDFEGAEEREPGLSVDPDDLGVNFLKEATEQGNFEGELRGDGADPSDAALTSPNFESDHDIWENTVNLTMQSATELDEVALVEEEDDALDEELDESDGLNLTESTIHSGSLLDSETDELGETREPNAITDDTNTHAKPRGGHKLPRAGGPSKPAAKSKPQASPRSR